MLPLTRSRDRARFFKALPSESPPPPIDTDNLLLEDGSALLLESGELILLES
jgi:hypothetical protein